MYTCASPVVHAPTLESMTTHDPEEAWTRYARELGVSLHRARIDRGITQERLAVAAGITTFTYRKLEKGESNPGSPANPRLRTLVALAEVLQVPTAALLPVEEPGVAIGR